AQAQKAYPTLGLADRDLAAALARHAPTDELCASCQIAEFALATAAALGSSTAIAELDRLLASTIVPVCRRYAGHGHSEDDLQQILRGKLFVAEADREPTIALYNGQGSLATWVRVIATRLFIDLGRRKDRARERATDDGEVELAAAGNVALELVKAEYREAIGAALLEAANRLEPGDRHLLRQHLVAGLTIDELGQALGVHRATAARRVAKARELFAETARALVAERLALDDSELAGVFGLVTSKLDLSIRRVLASRP
ncbi:MAG: sigma-70 family RNA polymerase sigma factor, partial [Kofleriaceae bacterium]